MSLPLESLARAASPAGRDRTTRELQSFLLIGGGAALAYVAVSSLLVGLHLGLADWLVSALCYAAFIVPVYLAHRRLSFHADTPHSVALPRYVAVQAGAIGLATLFSYVAYRMLGVPSPAAGLIVIALTSGVNFLALKLWAFARR